MNPKRLCGECGGTLENKVIAYTHRWGEQLYQFEDVPALVCLQCGHFWLSAEASQRIDEIVERQPHPAKYQKVPVFSLARPKARGAGA